MRTIAVLPIKSFGTAKQRLARMLGSGSRHLLAQAMFSDVLAALRRVRRLDAIAVVTEDHEAQAILRGEPVMVLHDHRREGQSAAAMIGIEHARAQRFDRVLLVAGDTPLADPRAIDGLLDASRADHLAVTIVPDRHREGTNALLIAPPGALQPSFGPGSLERHVQAARAGELAHRVEEVESLMHDVDTPEDLAALAEVLGRRRGVAPRTRGALSQFDRLHLRVRAPRPGERPASRPMRPDGAPGERAPADQTPAWA
jgi:2-phospho-L-lactate guanylyltransferase